MFRVGFGRHLWDIRVATLLKAHNSEVWSLWRCVGIPKEDQLTIVQLLSSNGIVYACTNFSAKSSIMLLYLRIFNIDRLLCLLIYFGIAFQALYCTAIISLTIGSIILCNGPEQITNKFCQAYSKPVVVLSAVVNVITDIYVLVLPIPRVLQLQVRGKERLG